MIILGLDPGLGTTGWGVIAAQGNRLSHLANGQIKTDPKAPLPERLVAIEAALTDLLIEHAPDGAGVEEVFVNTNAQSTLKLAHARGVILLCAANAGSSLANMPRGWSKRPWSAPAARKRRRSTRWSRACCPA